MAPRLPSRVPGAALLVAVLVVALACASCKRATSGQKPVASLADTTAAGRAFDHLRVEWVRNDPAERATLRHDIEAFVQAFPTDGLAPLVRLYGVLSLMDPPADWSRAEHQLDALPPPPPGATHDLYIVATAKVRRYHHLPDAAFELLRPIVGNIVDARVRALLQEELTFDALEAREPYEAIAYMDAWLRGASEDDRATSEAKVSIALGAVPEPALRGSLQAMRASAKGGESHGYGVRIQRLVGERLGQIAVERGDAALARWLLDPEVGEPMLGDEVTGALAQLATSRRGIGSVVGRTVGLVLPTSSAALRDEVADVLRGVLWALGIGRDDAVASNIRLVTRDDGGDPKRLRLGMEEVAGEGASVIITALDPETAAEALGWAATASFNVIVLAAPAAARTAVAGGSDAGARGVPLAAGFSVGEDWTSELAALGAALAGSGRGKGPIATLADTEARSSLLAAGGSAGGWAPPISCDLAPTTAGESRFPVGAWAAAGVRTWLVAGSVTCADDLLQGLRRGGRGGVVGLSLEASGTEAAPVPGLRVVRASAGIVPVGLAGAPDSHDPRVADARAMSRRTGAPAGWWTAVGHDAAALACAALARVPPDTTTDREEVARRRAAVREGLVEAHAPLWTSEHDGFDASRSLPRTIRVVDLGR